MQKIRSVLSVVLLGWLFSLGVGVSTAFAEGEEARAAVSEVETILQECRNMPLDWQDDQEPPHTVNPVRQKRLQLTAQLNSCNGRFGKMKFCRDLARGAVMGVGFTTAAVYAATTCAPYFFDLSMQGITANHVLIASRISTLAGAFVSSLNAAWNAWENCAITELEALQFLDQALRKEEKDKLGSYSSEVVELVSENYSELDQLFSQASARTNSVASKLVREKIFMRELYLLMFPNQTKDISLGSEELSTEAQSSIQEGIDGLLKNFPEIRNELNVLIEQVRENSSHSLAKPIRRVQRYLVGLPGTGKTFLVESIAQVLGLYVCRVTGNDLLDLKDLLGESVATLDGSKKEKVGKLPRCYREAGSTNFILFIDELGDAFRPDSGGGGQSDAARRKFQIIENLKLLMDPERVEVEFRAFGLLHVDFSRVTVLAAGNYFLTDSAALRRMPELRVPPLNPRQKALAFQAGYQSALAKLLTRREVQLETLKAVKAVVDQNLDYLFQKDSAFPGGGVIKEVLGEVFTHVFLEIRHGQSPTEIQRQLHQVSDRFFDSRMPVEEATLGDSPDIPHIL